CDLLAVAARSVTQMVQKHARAQRRPDAAWTQCTPALAHQAAWAVGALSLGPPRTRVKTARAEDIGKNGPVLSVPLTAPAVGWSSTATSTPGSIVCHWGNTACLRPRSSRIYPGELSQPHLRLIPLRGRHVLLAQIVFQPTGVGAADALMEHTQREQGAALPRWTDRHTQHL